MLAPELSCFRSPDRLIVVLDGKSDLAHFRGRPILDDFRHDFRGDRIGSVIGTGLICGFVSVVFAIANAAFLFTGPLQAEFASGFGMMLLSCVVFATTAAMLSSFPPMFAQTQEVPIVYLAVISAAMSPAASDPASNAPTVIALVSLSAVGLGVSFLLIGHFRLTGLIRFVPYPVVGGFLAGVAWLIVSGSLTILTGKPVSAASVELAMQPYVAVKLVLACIFVAGLLSLSSPAGRRGTMPLAVLIAVVLFNAVVWIADIPSAALQEARWLARPPAEASLWPPISASDVELIDWEAVARHAPTAAILIPVSMLALLMNISGMELQARRDIDYNAEFRAAGVANVVAGLGLGAPGYQTLSVTLLSMGLGGASRLTTLVAAGAVLSVLVAGTSMLSVLPLPVFASVILATGLSVLYDRLIRSYRVLALGEYLVLLAIFALTVWLGFVPAVIFGVGAAMMLFVVDYSRLNVVKHALSGKDFQSNAERSDARRRILEEHGGAILILRLQGYLFFGTADRLRKGIEQRLSSNEVRRRIRFLLIDFHLVSGLDSAAVQSFIRLAQTAERTGLLIVLTNPSPEALQKLIRGGLGAGKDGPVRISADLDEGLAACEHAIVLEVDPELAAARAQPIEAQLATFVGDESHAKILATYLETVQFGPGERFIEQGSSADEIYFIEDGAAHVRFETNQGRSIGIVTIGPGSIVGEIAFYLGRPRTASVVSDEWVLARRFTRERLDQLQRDAPETAFAFHRGMAAMLAERLAATDRLVRFLSE